MKRIIVDMSISLLHHGHVRLLARAKECGYVIVALTSDDEILKHKGSTSELSFEERKEILLGLKYVDEVVESPWTITDAFLKEHNADALFHSGDNFNEVTEVISCGRTTGVSTTDLRERAIIALVEKRNSKKCLLTPGPGNLHPENLFDLQPVFTRGDAEYQEIEATVLSRILALAGQDSIVTMQGSATTALEVSTHNFLYGKVAVLVSGYYSRRLFQMLQIKKDRLNFESLTEIEYDKLLDNSELLKGFDWVLAAYTETADAFLLDLNELRQACTGYLMLDATGSINLENNHHLADVCVFSSCKGLGGLAGAAFITYKNVVLEKMPQRKHEFILDLNTYIERKTTAPVHAICSLYSLSAKFSSLQERVRQSKAKFVERFGKYMFRPGNQPALCTKLSGLKLKAPPGSVDYTPRNAEPGTQVICHLFDQAASNRQPGEMYERMIAEPVNQLP